MDTIEQTGPAGWLDLEADGMLGSAGTTQLQEHFAQAELGSAEDLQALKAEKALWAQLHQALKQDRAQVRDSFQGEVMSAVDMALWQKAEAGAWRLPFAMMLVLALGAAWTLGGVSAENPVIGAGSVLADFVQSTFLAGAGVTVASWRGVGMGLEELLASSGLNWAALTMLVVCINMLFVSLLRRRPALAKMSTADSEGDEMSSGSSADSSL